MTNKNIIKENLDLFKKLIKKTELSRSSYSNYETWKSNYSKVNFTIDLIKNEDLLKAYYPNLRDKLFDIFSNIKL